MYRLTFDFQRPTSSRARSLALRLLAYLENELEVTAELPRLERVDQYGDTSEIEL